MKFYRSDGDYTGNDWTEDVGSESYLEQLQSRRSELLERAADRRAMLRALIKHSSKNTTGQAIRARNHRQTPSRTGPGTGEQVGECAHLVSRPIRRTVRPKDVVMSEKKILRGPKIVPTDPSKKPEPSPEAQMMLDALNQAGRIARGEEPDPELNGRYRTGSYRATPGKGYSLAPDRPDQSRFGIFIRENNLPEDFRGYSTKGLLHLWGRIKTCIDNEVSSHERHTLNTFLQEYDLVNAKIQPLN